MKFRTGLKTGLNSYSKALKFIIHHKLGGYFLFPLVLNIALFMLGYISVLSLSSHFFNLFSEWIHMDTWSFWGAGFLGSTLIFIASILIRILFLIIFSYTGGYIIVILLSPVYSILSEKVETILTGEEYPFSFTQFLNDIWRGIRIAIRNLVIELALTILLLILSFIPLVGLFTGLALFIISSYFYGFSFLDYSLERKKYDYKNSISFIRENRGIAIGNGCIFSITLMVPYIGILLSGFISIISVVAASIATVEIFVKNHKENPSLHKK